MGIFTRKLESKVPVLSYGVTMQDALAVLQTSAPNAAQYWVNNGITQGIIMFNESECEIVA